MRFAVTTAELPVTSPTPQEALEFIQSLVERIADSLEPLSLHVSLASARDPAVLRHLAEAVPPNTLGFDLGDGQGPVSAQRFLEQSQERSGPIVTAFRGLLTDMMPYQEAWSLLLDLTKGPQRAVTNAYYNVNISDIHIRQVPELTHGVVMLGDYKELRRKYRFYYAMMLIIAADDKKDPIIKHAAQVASAETGLPFDKAILSELT